MEKKTTFTKVARSENRLYGPRKLLVCGFPRAEQSEFLNIVKLSEIEELPTVWAESAQADETLKTLFAMEDMTGFANESKFLRAVIMGGITQKELHQLMGKYRSNGMAPSLWAVLTPTSENWTLRMLLEELDAERCKMRKKNG
ncbi:MAG: DUF3783 domain-containing protein [Desulfobacterales bacterium]